MLAEFKHTLGRLRGRIVGWSIGLGLYGLMMALLYDEVVSIEGIEEMLESYPEELMAFFGGEITSITTPVGYLDTYYFTYMVVIVGIFSLGAAAGLLAGDEEKGLLDLVLSHPVSRVSLFWGRVVALTAATVVVIIVSWLSWAVPSLSTSLDATWGELLLPFIPLLAQLLLFGALALFFSMWLPSSRMAAMLTAALLVGNYLLVGLANLNNSLLRVAEFTPLYYYQGGEAMRGIEWSWLAGILISTLLLTAVAWFLFRQRDIRVGGERTWRIALPALPRLRS